MKIKQRLLEHVETVNLILNNEETLSQIHAVVNILAYAFKNNKKVLICGNGGSASDAQHIAAELSGRFKFDREPLFAEALHCNTSYLTAVANDYGYEFIYSRLVKCMGHGGDVLICLSTSGQSKNIVNAIKEANVIGMNVILLTGQTPCEIDNLTSKTIKVPSTDTARIQECHILIGHIVCEIVEKEMFSK